MGFFSEIAEDECWSLMEFAVEFCETRNVVFMTRSMVTSSANPSSELRKLLRKARAADGRGYSSSAYEFYRQVLALSPGKESAWYRGALNLREIGRLKEAETYLSKIKNPPKDKLWLVELLWGRLRMEQFQPVEAEKHFAKAVRLNPGSTVPSVFLANLLAKREENKKATGVLLKALKGEGDIDEIYLNLALVKRAERDYEAARSYLAKALAITPRYRDARRTLVDVEVWLKYQAERKGARGKRRRSGVSKGTSEALETPRVANAR